MAQWERLVRDCSLRSTGFTQASGAGTVGAALPPPLPLSEGAWPQDGIQSLVENVSGGVAALPKIEQRRRRVLYSRWRHVFSFL